MPDHDARPRAVYDHNEDEPRPARRRRQAADWGVGEELFDHMPSRRFARRGDEHQIPRGGAEDGRRTIVIERRDAAPIVDEPDQAPDEAFASREEALRARRAHDALWGGDEPFADPAPAAEAAPDAPVELELPAEDARTVEPVRGGVDGRRTVKIGGRPGEHYRPSERRRPSRTVHERLGPRPDRIAAWACALGFLLILIAILTQ
ncbi:MAG TPA: hypothetical protein VFP78_08705 [Solirubrobacteraceae bacterium]|nr:hypothetical protein [Solirubrobacteraceae bacterium]